MKTSRSLPRLALLALAALVLALPSPARADRKLSIAEALELASRNNAELHLEEARIDEAVARRKSTRGLYGPKLMADGNLLAWNSAVKFNLNLSLDPAKLDLSKLGLTPEEGLALVQNANLLGALSKVFGGLDLGNIRDQVTGQLQLALAQPLTPLLQIHKGYKATEHLADAAVHDRDSKKLEILHKVKESYLQLMQVQRMAEVAKTGVEQVAEHLKRAKQFNEAGLIGKQDVLKAQLELARARERYIKASYGISLIGSALAIQLGLPMNETIVPTERVADPPPPLSGEVEAFVRRALEVRPELRSMQSKALAAEADKGRAKFDLIPQINAVATYQYTRGQGLFYPENTFFFGGLLKWEIWDWGGKYFAIKQAAARAAQAEVGKRLARDGISLQTKKAYLDLKQADEELTVARAAITEAEENFRIEQRRFQVNANTSTDVLDAQLALIRTKLTYTTALYGHYMARASLERAVGAELR